MGIQIGAKPDAGFNDPLGMLKDCHRRVERFLNILVVVVARAAADGTVRALTEEERDAVEAALKYFREGGRRHTADEEESLFPRMRQAGALPPEIEALEHDHDEAGPLHNAADELYTRWLKDGTLSAQDAAQLRAATERLRDLYAAHIRIEDTVVFPRAAEVLAPEELAAIGQEFRNRREL